jgi:hypothetical protein
LEKQLLKHDSQVQSSVNKQKAKLSSTIYKKEKDIRGTGGHSFRNDCLPRIEDTTYPIKELENIKND